MNHIVLRATGYALAYTVLAVGLGHLFGVRFRHMESAYRSWEERIETADPAPLIRWLDSASKVVFVTAASGLIGVTVAGVLIYALHTR